MLTWKTHAENYLFLRFLYSVCGLVRLNWSLTSAFHTTLHIQCDLSVSTLDSRMLRCLLCTYQPVSPRLLVPLVFLHVRNTTRRPQNRIYGIKIKAKHSYIRRKRSDFHISGSSWNDASMAKTQRDLLACKPKLILQWLSSHSIFWIYRHHGSKQQEKSVLFLPTKTMNPSVEVGRRTFNGVFDLQAFIE